eukprot:2203541-Rhodomonas_salina.2
MQNSDSASMRERRGKSVSDHASKRARLAGRADHRCQEALCSRACTRSASKRIWSPCFATSSASDADFSLTSRSCAQQRERRRKEEGRRRKMEDRRRKKEDKKREDRRMQREEEERRRKSKEAKSR